MTTSARKPAGIALILVLILGWAGLVTTAAPLLDGLSWPAHALYYGAGGLAWILPLKPLLRWIETGKWRG